MDNKSSINTVIMNFFSIDCSTEIGSLFIKSKSKTYYKIIQIDKSNNDLLMKRILDFFIEKNITFDDITNIFVNQGPGSYSGLRGSLSIAKGISLSKKKNLYGYNTFLWACSKFYNKEDFIYCIIKLRNKYFVKKFDKSLRNNFKIEEITEEQIANDYIKKIKIIPKNISKYFSTKVLDLNNLRLVDLDHNELEFLQLKGLLDKSIVRPLYLT